MKYEIWELAMWIHLLKKDETIPEQRRNELINQYTSMLRQEIQTDKPLNSMGYDAYFEMLHRQERTLDPVIKVIQDIEGTI